MAATLPYQDYVALSGLVLDWVDSYDSKACVTLLHDWNRLKTILAPKLTVDYSSIGGPKHEEMAAEDFVAVISGPEMFGDASLGTQHLIGASKWERIDEDKVIGHHQMRSTSVRLTGANSGEEKVEADRRVVVMQSYVKADGKWKLAGLKPMGR
ncbi:conidial pigment biosynthesis scytalone dehydratase arp1 [Colletotrichum asianum]|uniref:Conidial pigment biosynthesis scytalone dehydratase arp1 n=1 Tax=Colletotrichum asianum TaxID=702518 RepID=A0A8H3ZP80_9PEZI|nr:conidial pigment biosynthesis scytalone dehydratase arp1 [Colletotrichum asianum]